jgi:cytochrome c-type biogenesis protein CcmH
MIWIAAIALAGVFFALLLTPLLRRNPLSGTRASRFAAIAFVGVSPLLAGAIYWRISAPQTFVATSVETAQTISELPPEQRQAAIDAMVEGLAARLEVDPSDLDGWRMLARSYAALGRGRDAAVAYQQLTRQNPQSAADWRLYVDSLMALGPGGADGHDLAAAASALHRLAPDDPAALFLLGEAALSNGARAEAVSFWRKLLTVLPADATIRAQVEAMIAAAESGEGPALE